MSNKKQENSQKEIEELKKKCDEYLNGWKRAKADYINFKKEMEKEREEWIKFAHAGLILEILPIYNHLKQSLIHLDFMNTRIYEDLGADLRGKINSWMDGIRQIKKEFQDLFKNLGIEEIKTIGEKFNPEIHEAVKMTNDKWQIAARGNGEKELKIVKEVEPGYKMHGKVLVPAKVIVG